MDKNEQPAFEIAFQPLEGGELKSMPLHDMDLYELALSAIRDGFNVEVVGALVIAKARGRRPEATRLDIGHMRDVTSMMQLVSAPQHVVDDPAFRCIDGHMRPSCAIKRQRLDVAHAAVFDVHERRALWPRFPDAASLQISRIDDPGVAMQDFARVDMAQRPIIVTEELEVFDRARGIAGVSARAVEAGMQHADVEPALPPRRVFGDEVRRRPALGKTAAVDRDAQVRQLDRLRLAGGKNVDGVGIRQAAREHAFSVVIAMQ